MKERWKFSKISIIFEFLEYTSHYSNFEVSSNEEQTLN